MRLTKYCRLGLISLVLIVSMSGCWDIIPVEDRALVIMMGLDRNGGNIRLSVQVPTIKNLIQTASTFTDRQKPTFKLFVAESPSLLEDIQQLEDRIFQSMIIGTVKIIIISPQMAGADLIDNLTILLRQPMVSFQTLVLCADNRADEIVRLEAPFDIQPGLMLGKQQLSALKMARSFPIRLWDFVARVDNGITDPFLPIIKVDSENKSYLLEGIKVFHLDKLVGTLDPEESYLFGMLMNKIEEGYKEIDVNNKMIGLGKVEYKTKIGIRKHQQQNRMQIEVNARGTLLQIPKGFPNRVETYQLVKQEMEKQLKREVLSVVKRFQRLDTDPVGFRKHMEIAGIKNWSEAYPSIPVDVEVHFAFRNLSPAF